MKSEPSTFQIWVMGRKYQEIKRRSKSKSTVGVRRIKILGVAGDIFVVDKNRLYSDR